MGAAQVSSAVPQKIQASWSALASALGRRFGGESAVAAVAISAPGLPGAVWDWRSAGSRDSLSFDSIRVAARVFAEALPVKPLALCIRLPEGPDGAPALRSAVEAALESAPERLLVVVSNLSGAKASTDALRPSAEVLREMHGRIGTGVWLDRIVARQAAEESEEPAGERFRRALAFGRWIGARHFLIDAEDAGSHAIRADLMHVKSR